MAYITCIVLAAVVALRLMALSFSPTPFADMWNELPFIRRALEGRGDLASWWAQHNEHRILLPRVQFVADYGLFGGRGLFLLGMIFLSCVLLAALLTWPIRRVWNDWTVILGFSSVALWAMLTPADWENLTWSFQVGFVQVFLFSVAAITLLVTARTDSGGRCHPAVLPLVVLAGTAATLSLANGLIVWPILISVAFVRRLRRRSQAVLVGVGLIEIAAYLRHFHPVAVHTPYSETLRHPLAATEYVAAYLGHPAQSLGLRAAEAFGALGLGVFCVLTVLAIKSRGQEKDTAFLLAAATAGFVVLTACETAIGRLDFGLSEALASRYAIASSVFWVALAVGLAQVVASTVTVSIGRLRTTDVTGMAFVSICLVAAVCAGLASRPDVAGLINRRAALDGVAAAYEGGVRDGSVLADVLAPPTAMADLGWLARKRLGPWSSSELDRFSERRPAHIAGLPACPGHIDGVQHLRGADRYVGWITTPSRERPSAYVSVATSSGKPEGMGYVGFYRPDVKLAQQSSSDETGFVAFARTGSSSALLVAFGHGESALCELRLR